MGAYSGVGAYLSSSGSEVGAYMGGGLIQEWGHNRSFTVLTTDSRSYNVIKNGPYDTHFPGDYQRLFRFSDKLFKTSGSLFTCNCSCTIQNGGSLLS